MDAPDPTSPLPRLAHLRARGCPWDTVARKLDRPRPELERAAADPVFRRLLVKEQAAVLDELFAESVTVLREALWLPADRARPGRPRRCCGCGPPSTATAHRHAASRTMAGRTVPAARRTTPPARRQSAPTSPASAFITSASSTVA